MNVKQQPLTRAAAVAAALSLIVEAWAPIFAAPQSKPAAPAPAGQTTAKPAAPAAPTPAKPAATATAATPPAVVDGGWPRAYSLPSGGNILMYQPQISSWEKQARVVAFSAVSYRDKGAEKPTYGTVKLEADTKVALDDRLVRLQNMKLAEANFSTLQKEQVREIVNEIDKAMPDDDRV